MRTQELTKLLKNAGCYKVREGKNHEIWYSPIVDDTFPVWRHKGEIPTGTANAILKQAGLR